MSHIKFRNPKPLIGGFNANEKNTLGLSCQIGWTINENNTWLVVSTPLKNISQLG